MILKNLSLQESVINDEQHRLYRQLRRSRGGPLVPIWNTANATRTKLRSESQFVPNNIVLLHTTALLASFRFLRAILIHVISKKSRATFSVLITSCMEFYSLYFQEIKSELVGKVSVLHVAYHFLNKNFMLNALWPKGAAACCEWHLHILHDI